MALPPNTPSNGSNEADPWVIPGWTVQGSPAQNALGTGTPSPGYAEQGIVADESLLTTTGNGTPGAPAPLTGNVTDVLRNPGYSDVAPSLITPGSVIDLPSGFTGIASARAVAFTSGTATFKPLGAATAVTATIGATIPGGSTITTTAASVVTTL